MQPTSISQLLGAHLVREKEVHDLSRNPEFAAFQFIGLRTSPVAVELVAFCDADQLNERKIVRRRDEFFTVLRQRPREFGVKPRGRNPNGLLGFVFAEGCSEQMARFVARQTRIDHAAGTGGVSVAWAIDARNGRIHTHDNPVSVFPPVVVLARTVYPGLDYLQSLLHRLPDAPPVPAGEKVAPVPRAARAEPEPLEKIHILFLAANSRTSPLDLEREYERIETHLRLAKVRDQLELTPVLAATMDRLTQAMLDESPTIIHFSGHGEQEGIVLRDDGNGEHLVSGEDLAKLFALFSKTVQCVVLNACWSEEQAHAIRRHVPHVISMRDEIPDSTAIAFSTGFYKAIAARRDVEFAYRLGITRAGAEGEGGVEHITLL